jgi:hypothetical protein
VRGAPTSATLPSSLQGPIGSPLSQQQTKADWI